MKFKKFLCFGKRFTLSLLVFLILFLSVVTVSLVLQPHPGSPEALLTEADRLGWNNRWLQAQPIYARSEEAFRKRGDRAHALYAQVSQFPVKMESSDLSTVIAELSHDLTRSEATDPATRLRILEMKAKCEEEYDAALSKTTFSEVQRLALQLRKWRLASRASGEQGILAFTLGDTREAASKVKRAYAIAKYLGDPAAHVRYAEMIGEALVQLGRPQQALKFLNEAIDAQRLHPNVASPSVAYAGKIQTLAQLGRYKKGLALADRVMDGPRKTHLYGQLQSLLTSRSELLQIMGKDADAVRGYEEALSFARRLHSWRALSKIGGRLSTVYEHLGQLKDALFAIDQAIEANEHTPRELFLVPGNLAIKARILQEMGKKAEAEGLYVRGMQILDLMLQHVPTPELERQILSELGDLYSGYFSLLATVGRYSEAFEVIESAHGRIEAQQIRFDHTELPHEPTPDDLQLQVLISALVQGTRNQDRTDLLEKIRSSQAEFKIVSQNAATSLAHLQASLRSDELFVEYVLSAPQSFALAVNSSSIALFRLPARPLLEREGRQYRDDVVKHKTDSRLAQTLYKDLLNFTSNYSNASSLILVPDGALHLLPFAALETLDGKFLVESKSITVSPSGSVLTLLRSRPQSRVARLPYLGVAAWAAPSTSAQWVLRSGLPDASLRDLAPLPQSRIEIESIKAMLPAPARLLIGSEATKQTFERLPLSNYRVLHLALHGLTDPVYPEHSALAFAPAGNDDGRLEARDIRKLRINADLVTLSACNTAVGPVDPSGVDSLVTSFLQAGANSVVATLWGPEDHAASEFMKSFYGNVTKLDEANALRQAQLALLRLGVRPYDWAGYEVVGNTKHPLFANNDTH